MSSFYIDSASIDCIEITSSFISTPTATITFPSNVTLSGSFSGSFSGNGSNLTNIKPQVFKSTVSSSAVTGTVNETLATSILIPANTFTTGSIIYMQARTLKTGTAGTNTIRAYFNTTASISGAVLMGLYTGGTTTTFAHFVREAAIKLSGQTEHLAANAITDTAQSTTAFTNSTINWAVNQYFVISLTNTSAADSSRVSFYRLYGV